MDREKTRSRGKTTILLVEDEEIVSNATSEMLSCLGYRVLTADNGHEALRAYRQQHEKIDLIVLDLNMPLMDGMETYRQLRELNPNVKIILSTASPEVDKVFDQFDFQQCGYLRKPYMPRELAAEIERVFLSC